MSSIYRNKYTATDPATGKVVTKFRSKWYGKYKDSDEILRRVPLSTNKVAAQQMLNKLVEQAERGKSGLVDPFQEHLTTPLTEHLTGFQEFLEAKANTPEHVTLSLSRIRAVIAGCGFKRLADLNADKVGNWLKTRRDAGEGRFGVATSNHHLVAIKSFGNWLVKAQRLPRNPFAHLSRLNAKVDVRIERRALDAMELTCLIETTLVSLESFRGLTGEDRAMLYLVASTTGLRANELANLTPEAFDLTTESPTVTIKAKTEKSRRGAVLPILPLVAKRLDQWLSSRSVRRLGRLWAGTWSEKAAVMFRRDLQAARDRWLGEAEQNPAEHAQRLQSEFLKPETLNGERADFHALRHSFVSMLASSGVHPKTAQMLARHSTITLTMDRYSHVRLADLSQAVQTMPSLLNAPEPDGIIRFAGTQPPVPCCPPCCPADDFSCNALTTIDVPTPISLTGECVGSLGDSLSADGIYLNSIAETEVKALGLEPRTYGLKVRCSTD